MLGVALGGPTFAAEQPVPTKTLIVKNPSSGARRVLWKVVERSSAATVVGDPTVDGASLHVVLTPGGDQCVPMPASGWTPIGTIGFRYTDRALANGPIKTAQVKKTQAGTFQLRALLRAGGPTPIAVAPGDPTTSWATKFTLGTGDEYCGGSATATPDPNGATVFKVSNDGAPAGCVAACGGAVTTSTVATASSTTSTGVTPTSSTTSTTAVTSCAVPVVPPLRIVDVNATAAAFSTFAKQPPGSSDWYIVEQQGRIRIIRGGAFLASTFLDVRTAMGNAGTLGERGLLSVAFHPSYATNGRFFTMGTPGDGADGTYAATNADAVVEWQRDPMNADLALATKVRDIVVLATSDTNHNGGTILFGPDGFLYVATGDGGGGCESSKPGAVQNTSTLFGKVLRLNVDGSPPFAAPGNPFASDARVYHYGLRNPFRFNFDSLTNDLFIGDVGQNAFEEINVAPGNVAGLNFGWPAIEGNTVGTCAGKSLGGPSPATAPLVEIDRRPGSTSPFADYSSVIGGRVYRGSAIPALQGVYLFADFGGQEMGAIRYCSGQLAGPVAIPLSSIQSTNGFGNVSSFVGGNDGELYVTYGVSTRIGRLAPQ
jgi:glucose/arabinose dehydrogenase